MMTASPLGERSFVRDASFSSTPSTPLPKSDVVHEIEGDLFRASRFTSLAHCVSSDLRMGKGIAVVFKRKFGQVEELKNQKKTVGETAYIQDGSRYIFYLITKENCYDKPTEHSLRQSLLDMKHRCKELGVTNVAMPRVGCGLDGLHWPSVFRMLCEIFSGCGMQITIYNLSNWQSPLSSPFQEGSPSMLDSGRTKSSFLRNWLLSDRKRPFASEDDSETPRRSKIRKYSDSYKEETESPKVSWNKKHSDSFKAETESPKVSWNARHSFPFKEDTEFHKASIVKRHSTSKGEIDSPKPFQSKKFYDSCQEDTDSSKKLWIEKYSNSFNEETDSPKISWNKKHSNSFKEETESSYVSKNKRYSSSPEKERASSRLSKSKIYLDTSKEEKEPFPMSKKRRYSSSPDKERVSSRLSKSQKYSIPPKEDSKSSKAMRVRRSSSSPEKEQVKSRLIKSKKYSDSVKKEKESAKASKSRRFSSSPEKDKINHRLLESKKYPDSLKEETKSTKMPKSRRYSSSPESEKVKSRSSEIKKYSNPSKNKKEFSRASKKRIYSSSPEMEKISPRLPKSNKYFDSYDDETETLRKKVHTLDSLGTEDLYQSRSRVKSNSCEKETKQVRKQKHEKISASLDDKETKKERKHKNYSDTSDEERETPKRKNEEVPKMRRKYESKRSNDLSLSFEIPFLNSEGDASQTPKREPRKKHEKADVRVKNSHPSTKLENLKTPSLPNWRYSDLDRHSNLKHAVTENVESSDENCEVEETIRKPASVSTKYLDSPPSSSHHIEPKFPPDDDSNNLMDTRSNRTKSQEYYKSPKIELFSTRPKEKRSNFLKSTLSSRFASQACAQSSSEDESISEQDCLSVVNESRRFLLRNSEESDLMRETQLAEEFTIERGGHSSEKRGLSDELKKRLGECVSEETQSSKNLFQKVKYSPVKLHTKGRQSTGSIGSMYSDRESLSVKQRLSLGARGK